jgi:transcriptional regulator with XRE-family HTH domain
MRSIRLSKGLTQSQLSDRIFDKTGIRISVTTISYFETNERQMSALQLRAAAIALKTTEKKLYEWTM